MRKFSFILSALCLLFLSSCNESSNTPYQRKYCIATFRNNSTYVVQVFIDGKSNNNLIIVPGEESSYTIDDVSFSKDFYFEYHTITNVEGSTYYYSTDVALITELKNVGFVYTYDRLFNITNNGVQSRLVEVD
ncbi:MAG: hypothetical protein PUK04_00525 [Bacteroidales bacterium]|nr:hypothetical protein [Bacteroidales bacterium]MDY6037266.1 hypothetical protein [Paludibacteraceae bacterium]